MHREMLSVPGLLLPGDAAVITNAAQNARSVTPLFDFDDHSSYDKWFKGDTRAMVVIGESAPAIKFLDQDEVERRLTDLTGPNGLVLHFYRGFW
ncbi:MAG TPA: hypothetical protein VN709_05275 [Terriglobales bacterium]|nr:hypothetical protein [Terriglobales bacterium]